MLKKEQEKEKEKEKEKAMKGIFKSKPRTPAELVRATRELLAYVDTFPVSRETKREEKVLFPLMLLKNCLFIRMYVVYVCTYAICVCVHIWYAYRCARVWLYPYMSVYGVVCTYV